MGDRLVGKCTVPPGLYTMLRCAPLVVRVRARRCRAPGVRSRSGRDIATVLEYDGTGGCYYGNGTARRVRYELSRAPLVDDACMASQLDA